MRVLTVLLLALAVARADELAWRDGPHNWYRARKVELSTEAPEGVLELEQEAPRYFRTGRLLLATSGDRLWVDTNLDGNLQLEDPVDMKILQTWATAMVRVDERKVYVYRRREQDEPELWITVLSHRAGDVVLGGRLRPIELFDRNHDLALGDPEDAIYLDLDGDGKVDRGADSLERVVPGRAFRVADKGYKLHLEGGSVRFEVVASAPPAPVLPWESRSPPDAGVEATPGKVDLDRLKVRYLALSGRGGKKVAPMHGPVEPTIRQIGALGSRPAFDYLRRIANTDRTVAVRVAAVRAMGYAQYLPWASRVVAIARKDRDPEVRAAAIEALHAMNAPAREELFTKILERDKEEPAAAAAAFALGWLNTPGARETLRAAALGHPRLAFRVYAYEALTRYTPEPPEREVVLAAARASDPRLRLLGLGDARKLGYGETRLLALEAARGATDTGLQLAVAEILGVAGDPEAIGALLAIGDGAAASVRGRIVDLLRPMRGAASVDALLGGLEWTSPAVRALVADILREVPDPRVGPALATRLVAERQEPALTALVRAAGAHRVAAAAGPIAAAMRADPDNATFQATGTRALGRIGLAHPEVHAFFLEKVGSPDWEARVLALDAVAASGDAAAAAVLRARLDDPVWQVRLAAVQGLGRVRVKESIPALIDRLEKEGSKRIRRAVAETLHLTTGVNLYDMAELWRRWWKEQGAAFEVPAKPPAPEGDPGERRTVASFYGIPVESDRIVFVIDRSGSMGGRGADGSRYDRAVAETLKVVAKVEKGARFNVVLFETKVARWRKALTKADSRSRAKLKAFLGSKGPRGGTNLWGGLHRALLMEDVETIYLLSDGAPTEGAFVRSEEILNAVRRLNQTRRITIHCVAVGFDSALLRALADQNNGAYAVR